jgi:hypothetical protein
MIKTKKAIIFNTINLPSGIYFFNVIDNGKVIQSGKMVSKQ